MLPLLYAVQYLPSTARTLTSLIPPAALARVRDSRNAMDSDKYK